MIDYEQINVCVIDQKVFVSLCWKSFLFGQLGLFPKFLKILKDWP